MSYAHIKHSSSYMTFSPNFSPWTLLFSKKTRPFSHHLALRNFPYSKIFNWPFVPRSLDNPPPQIEFLPRRVIPQQSLPRPYYEGPPRYRCHASSCTHPNFHPRRVSTGARQQRVCTGAKVKRARTSSPKCRFARVWNKNARAHRVGEEGLLAFWTVFVDLGN